MRALPLSACGLAMFALACDPMAGIVLRQPLGVAPTRECIRAALGSSPLVASVQGSYGKDELTGYSIGFTLRDSVPAHRVMPPNLAVVVRDNEVAVEVSMFYFGRTTFTLTGQEIDDLSAAATPIARLIRDSCAPSSRSVATCRVEGFGKSRSCTPVG